MRFIAHNWVLIGIFYELKEDNALPLLRIHGYLRKSTEYLIGFISKIDLTKIMTQDVDRLFPCIIMR